MVELRILSGAEADYRAALSWYAQRSTRAAEGLEREFEHVLTRIASTPDRYPLCDERHRFLLLKRYPLQVIYRSVNESLVLIVAVAHTSRQPDFWSGR